VSQPDPAIYRRSGTRPAIITSVLLLMAVSIAAVVAIVVVRRRSLRPLLGLRLRWVWLVWLAALVQLVRTRDPQWAGAAVPLLVMWLLGLAFVVANLRTMHRQARLGAVILAAGFSLNTLVTVFNGAMPFSATSARLAGVPAAAIETPAYGHAPIDADTALAVLADVIPVPGAGVVVSVGDVLMVAGVAWLLSQLALGPRHHEEKSPQPAGKAQ
jgi:uncharacterized protein DUF5317